ncbi:DNA ligase isoform X2 [Spatholobus suberectus]|nr:DNA ligase isoform X2 [Spatholobus suberectus]
MKKNEEHRNSFNEAKKRKKTMKKNMSRLGPISHKHAIFFLDIQKQREFYKNAKNVKKLLKQQNLQHDLCPPQSLKENENETKESYMVERRKKKKSNALSLEELYKKKHEEKEK